MKTSFNRTLAAVSVVTLGLSFADQAKAATPANTHLSNVTVAYAATPNQDALLNILQSELALALREARGMVAAEASLFEMRAALPRIRQIIDPTLGTEGPGLGYGLIQAAMDTARYLNLAATSSDATSEMKTHAAEGEAAARNIARLGERTLAFAHRIEIASSNQEAHQAAKALLDHLLMMQKGFDDNGDGVIAFTQPEGGLTQMRQSLGQIQGTTNAS